MGLSQMSSCSGLMPALVVHGTSAGLAAGLSGLRDPGWVKQRPVVPPDGFCRCSGVRRWRPGTRFAVRPKQCVCGGRGPPVMPGSPRREVGDPPRRWLTTQVGEYRRAVSVVAAAFSKRLLTSGSVQPDHHMGPPVAPSAPLRPPSDGRKGHKPHSARRRHHIRAAGTPPPRRGPHLMAVGARCSGGRASASQWPRWAMTGMPSTTRSGPRSTAGRRSRADRPDPGDREGPDAVQPGSTPPSSGRPRSTPPETRRGRNGPLPALWPVSNGAERR